MRNTEYDLMKIAKRHKLFMSQFNHLWVTPVLSQSTTTSSVLSQSTFSLLSCLCIIVIYGKRYTPQIMIFTLSVIDRIVIETETYSSSLILFWCSTNQVQIQVLTEHQDYMGRKKGVFEQSKLFKLCPFERPGMIWQQNSARGNWYIWMIFQLWNLCPPVSNIFQI